MDTLRRLSTAARRTAKEPQTFIDLWRKAKSRPITALHQRKVDEYPRVAVGLEDALATMLGVAKSDLDPILSRPTFKDVMAALDSYRVPTEGVAMGGPAHLALCYCIVAMTQPEIVLETGVAHGYSTSVILQALHDNGQGALYSVDLPAFRPGVTRLTGEAIPPHLAGSGRWHLSAGSDDRVLPGLLRKLPPLDVAFYDSEKSYDGMLRTWRRLWQQLRPGGLLILDDVDGHDAYFDFCDEVGLRPVVVAKPTSMQLDPSTVWYAGLLRKP
jgi:predicted O-methyltransferase YrrM